MPHSPKPNWICNIQGNLPNLSLSLEREDDHFHLPRYSNTRNKQCISTSRERTTHLLHKTTYTQHIYYQNVRDINYTVFINCSKLLSIFYALQNKWTSTRENNNSVWLPNEHEEGAEETLVLDLSITPTNPHLRFRTDGNRFYKLMSR